MAKPVLTKEIAYGALQDFFAKKPLVLFGTGTSCAIDKDFGMEPLFKKLSEEIPKRISERTILSEWKSVEENFLSTYDFESAMNAIKHDSLLDLIVQETFKHVKDVDQKACIGIFKEDKKWSAISLLKKIVDNLPPNDPVLHVATPNYDMVAEYAFSVASIPYITGFWGGIVKKIDWAQASRTITFPEKISEHGKQQLTTRKKNHIRLYKVHGSLNTFLMHDKIVECDIWKDNMPDFVKPMIITPGESKHQKIHNFRSVLLKEFDDAVNNHNAFLFLGFGFNDTQLINDKIKPKLKAQVPALIITRDLNKNIEELLKVSENCWIVCKQIDTANNYTRIYNSKFDDWLYIDDQQLWNFEIFTTVILGG